MSEYAGAEKQPTTIDTNDLLESRAAIVFAINEMRAIHELLKELDRQVSEQKQEKRILGDMLMAELERYRLDIVAAAESGVLTDDEIINIYVDYHRMDGELYGDDEAIQKAKKLKDQYHILEPGVMIAYPESRNTYSAAVMFNFNVVTLAERPKPTLSVNNRDLVLGYEITQEETITERADSIIVGEEELHRKLDAAVKAFNNICDAHEPELDNAVYVLTDQNNIIDLAEKLGRPDDAHRLHLAKTALAAKVLRTSTRRFIYSQAEYDLAARHLYFQSQKDYYDVLGDMITDADEILSRCMRGEYTQFAAMYYARLSEADQQYHGGHYSEADYLRAGAWFMRQKESLDEANAKVAQSEV